MSVKALFLPCVALGRLDKEYGPNDDVEDVCYYLWSCPFCNKNNITYEEDFRELGVECSHCQKVVKPCFDVGER
jgi:hypothetical protein